MTVIVTIFCLAYFAWISFNMYNEIFKADEGGIERINKWMVSKTHNELLRRVGLVWSVLFLISLFAPVLQPAEHVLFLVINAGAWIWVVRNAYRLYKERSVIQQKDE